MRTRPGRAGGAELRRRRRRGALEALSSTLLPPAPKRAAVVTQDGIGVDVDTGASEETLPHRRRRAGQDRWPPSRSCAGRGAGGASPGDDVVVAVGGGVVTDVAGFAAASYHRGVAVVHVPTTLLGMVDAAIGGKTGVNLPEGKNLVGAFWQPSGVVCDLDALATLPPRELRSGHGELAKYHFLTGDDLDAMDLEERVAAAVRIKADVVAVRRAGGRHRRSGASRHPQLRAHAGPRPGDRRHLRPARHGEAVAIGLRLRRPAGAPAGPHRRRRVDDAPRRSCRPTACRRPCPERRPR